MKSDNKVVPTKEDLSNEESKILTDNEKSEQEDDGECK